MYFDDGNLYRRNRVADRNAVVGECGCVQDDVVRRPTRRLYCIHKHALVI